MSALEDLVQAAMEAPASRRQDALRILRGEATEPPRAQPEPYLTLRETAKRLGISTGTLWRWQIPGHELGGRPRFRISEVEAYLKCEEFKRRVSALRAIRRSRPKQETHLSRTATARGAKVQRTTSPERLDNDPSVSS
jgi:excisionase family DNA binding protein